MYHLPMQIWYLQELTRWKKKGGNLYYCKTAGGPGIKFWMEILRSQVIGGCGGDEKTAENRQSRTQKRADF